MKASEIKICYYLLKEQTFLTLWLSTAAEAPLSDTSAPPIYLGILHQHVFSGNPVIVHLQVAIIYLIKAKFGADISNSNTYQR